MHFEDTGLPWVMPSPNMPTVDTAFVYPGGCLVEGTNLSEGRGTTRPFELVGAPWLDPWALARDLERESACPASASAPSSSAPTFQKHAGVLCGGVQVHVTDRARFPAFLTYLLLIHHARRQDPATLRLARPAVRVRARQAADRHPVRHRPHPHGHRARHVPARRSCPSGAKDVAALQDDAGGGSCCTDAASGLGIVKLRFTWR